MFGADAIAEGLIAAGVPVVFGVGGANIEDVFAAVQRRRPRIRAILCKHEHQAGTAADAYARITGTPGVVMTTSGGGAMNLVPALAEAYASRVPVVAIVGEPPASFQGQGAFQDTSGRGGSIDAAKVFREVSRSCTRVAAPDQLARLVLEAWQRATEAPPGPRVLLISKDVQQASVEPEPGRTSGGRETVADRSTAECFGAALRALDAPPVLVVVGDQVARQGAAPALEKFVDAFDAHVCLTPDGKDGFDNQSRRCLGVLGAMGHTRVNAALTEAGVVVLTGTRLPLLARQGLEAILREKPLVCLSQERPYVTGATLVELRGGLEAILEQLTRARSSASAHHAGVETPTRRASPTRASTAAQALDLGSTTQLIQRSLPEASVVLIDAGNTGASSVHHIECPKGGRWLIAMGMAGMGYTFGAAIGAAVATGRRCTVVAGDGAFFMHGLEIHTAVEHGLPITYVIVDNRAHGMCLVREQLLLGSSSGYNSFRVSRLAAGLGTMFPGLATYTCRTRGELDEALRAAHAQLGPAVVCAELAEVDVPPFTAFAPALARGIRSVSRRQSP